MRLRTGFTLVVLAVSLSPCQAVLSASESVYGKGLPRDFAELHVPDSEFPDWPLRPEHADLSGVSGERMKQWVERIAEFSLQSRRDGHAYWGRLPGTPYERQTRELVDAELRRLGFDIQVVPFTIPEDWRPRSWSASYQAGDTVTELHSAFPVGETAATPSEGLSAEAVWVGIGAEPDFLDRDVRGKAVIIYSTFVPGGRSHSASRRARLFYANQRATENGAAFIINIMGVPGNARFNPLGAPPASHGVPLITINQDEGFRLRDLLGAGKRVEVRLQLNIDKLKDIETAISVATLPGVSDEQVVLAAHTDGFFEGAMDNAAGLASGLEIARHYAAMPRELRPRTLLFMTFPDHHHGEFGLKLFERSHDWDRVALALTLEHPAQTQLYWYNNDLMTSNAIGAFRWNALGSDRFVRIVSETLREFGVSVYREMNPKPKLTRQAPGFHIIDHVIYHTTLDVPNLVPAEGLERSTRAFIRIIDRANQLTLQELR